MDSYEEYVGDDTTRYRINLYLFTINNIQNPTNDMLRIKKELLQSSSKHTKDIFQGFRELIAQNVKYDDKFVYFYSDVEYENSENPNKEKLLRLQPTFSLKKLFTYFFGRGDSYLMNRYVSDGLSKMEMNYVNGTIYKAIYTQSFLYLDQILENVLDWRINKAQLKDLPDYEDWLEAQLKIYLIDDLLKIILRYSGTIKDGTLIVLNKR